MVERHSCDRLTGKWHMGCRTACLDASRVIRPTHELMPYPMPLTSLPQLSASHGRHVPHLPSHVRLGPGRNDLSTDQIFVGLPGSHHGKAIAVDHDLRDPWTSVIIRCHSKAVGTCAQYGEQITRLTVR